MYRKVLIPLDGSKESEEVFATIKEDLAPDTEVILLRVVPPGKTYSVGGQFVSDGREEDELAKAQAELQAVVERIGGVPRQFRCETTASNSVVDSIMEAAERVDADLIAMYTHDRRGIAKLVQRSVAGRVRRRAPVEVKIFKPHELATVP